MLIHIKTSLIVNQIMKIQNREEIIPLTYLIHIKKRIRKTDYRHHFDKKAHMNERCQVFMYNFPGFATSNSFWAAQYYHQPFSIKGDSSEAST